MYASFRWAGENVKYENENIMKSIFGWKFTDCSTMKDMTGPGVLGAYDLIFVLYSANYNKDCNVMKTYLK